MKKITVILALTLGLSNLASAGSVLNTTDSKPLNVSYVQTSDLAVLDPVDAKAGNYTLTMYCISPFITYFSDRPNRVIGKLPTTAFLAKWKQGANNFGQDAPNAVLNGITNSKKPDASTNIIMELSNPAYNQTEQSLTYQVHILSNGKAAAPVYPLTKLTYSTLFIDDDPCISCMAR